MGKKKRGGAPGFGLRGHPALPPRASSSALDDRRDKGRPGAGGSVDRRGSDDRGGSDDRRGRASSIAEESSNDRRVVPTRRSTLDEFPASRQAIRPDMGSNIALKRRGSPEPEPRADSSKHTRLDRRSSSPARRSLERDLAAPVPTSAKAVSLPDLELPVKDTDESTISSAVYQLCKGRQQFVANVGFAEDSKRSPNVTTFLEDVQSGGTTPSLFLKKMVPLSHLKGSLISTTARKTCGFSALTLEKPSTDALKSVQALVRYLSAKQRVGVISLRRFTLFVLPTIELGTMGEEEVDAEIFPLFCVIADKAKSPRTLTLQRNKIELKTISPLLAYSDFVKTHIMLVQKLPEKTNWLVEGKRVHVYGPHASATMELTWLLRMLGAQCVANPKNCDFVMCHRSFHEHVPLLPHLNELKLGATEFVLWGHSTGANIKKPILMFPAGGILTLTYEALCHPGAAKFLERFKKLARTATPGREWGCVLHPDVAQKIKPIDGIEPALQHDRLVAWHHIMMLEHERFLRFATPDDVYFADSQEDLAKSEHAMMLRLQYIWSLNFRHFVVVRAENQDQQPLVGGIDEINADQFFERYMPWANA
ncbi:uncharacterized protein EV422DRAFT_528057 [Fimicolochytrium jonesii]|uniref:uncharacterized protein n=1 Tax=Fimicolochytrium jonesii TaxID=1396493 RepID=UPI0022FE13FE|nr:uncharacterized protein EV422DRAFT_528057 [Fimicolochytrium jonesii]KAI8821410.1 hypothetical protein EV422DRAFT_528057 [Fimicolochytrium jonesii]